MTFIKSTDLLEQEHRVVATVSVIADRLDAGHKADAARARRAPEPTRISGLSFNVAGELEGAVLVTIAWRGAAG